ncbi:MAG: LysM repeat protein [Myxococcota bacterium]|jgi:LysM repeat protein
MRSLLPLITLLVACSTEPTPTIEPHADPPAITETAPDVATYTTAVESDTFEPAHTLESAETAPAIATTNRTPAGLFSTDPDAPTSSITIQDGESLALIADWSGVISEEIASLNDIDVSDPLYPGQELILPELSAGSVETERVAFTKVRLSRYLDRRGGLSGMRTYRVQTGDTAWGIARTELGVPTWVLSHYNGGDSLDRLIIGQELLAPVLGDEVTADSDELAQ